MRMVRPVYLPHLLLVRTARPIEACVQCRNAKRCIEASATRPETPAFAPFRSASIYEFMSRPPPARSRKGTELNSPELETGAL